jgi:plasmid stabilization system protein ParE
MRVRYSKRAFADREAIFQYLNELSPQGARSVKQSLVYAIRLLGLHPYMGPPTDFPGVRELNVPRRPYKVYHRVQANEVWVIHIRDARQRPWEGEKQPASQKAAPPHGLRSSSRLACPQLKTSVERGKSKAAGQVTGRRGLADTKNSHPAIELAGWPVQASAVTEPSRWCTAIINCRRSRP